jgi:exopolyphosphatase/guanosine-5'-triphosphate,3'-diphosphate pyrophosphatase
VISAKEEATNAFLGATYVLEPGKKYLVMDIGGGSTELIAGINKDVLEFYSKDIGCVRLFEMFVRSDPPSGDEISKIRNYIENIYSESLESLKKHAPFDLIGTAGTVTSFSAIAQGLKKYDVEKVHHSVLTLEKVKEVSDNLIKMSLDERGKIPTMEHGREDVIIAGAVILATMMEMLEKKELLVSETDILDGLLLSG